MSKDKRMMWIAACACAGLMIAFGMSFSVQAGGQNANGNMNSNMGGMNGNSNMKMGMNPDAKFMMMAAQGGMAEVAMGRVALDHAASDAVKQYAQKMIDDHTANNQELMTLAASKGVTLPTAPDAKHQMMMDKMSKMSGAQFDMEYVKNSGVKDHEAMEKLMMKESDGGKDADAKAFAAKTLPVVRMHLQMARDMAMNMKNMGGGMNGNSNMNSNMNMNGNMNSNMKHDKKSGNMNGNMNSNMGMNSNNSNR